ncbi:hypothetical protein [Bradyrhizobium canariense]|uniref:hypothetical protein n=1 Tax=Bradyrhizobium canariense TaxID=255045 RepID=UPI001B8A3DF9|nr:hypothetical protein [Bradyrhizobium canariense]MBR0955684.1 hypothetical protein [Bradyrhizobium canariense]
MNDLVPFERTASSRDNVRLDGDWRPGDTAELSLHDLLNEQGEPKLDPNEVLEHCVEGYRKFRATSSIDAVIQCTFLVKAVRQGEAQMKAFCEQVGLDPKSATFRKKRRIGEGARRLLTCGDALPSAWTTLYELAKLDPAVLYDLVSRGVLKPEMTAKELRQARSPDKEGTQSEPSTSQPALEGESCRLVVDATGLTNDKQLDLFQELQKVAAGFGLVVTGLPEFLAQKLLEVA